MGTTASIGPALSRLTPGAQAAVRVINSHAPGIHAFLPLFVSATRINTCTNAERRGLAQHVVRFMGATTASDEYTAPLAYHLVLTGDRPTPAGVSLFMRELLAQREMGWSGGIGLGLSFGLGGWACLAGAYFSALSAFQGSHFAAGMGVALLLTALGVAGHVMGGALAADWLRSVRKPVAHSADQRSESTLPPLSLDVWDAGDRLDGAESAEPLLVAHIERVSGFWPGVHSRQVDLRVIAAIDGAQPRTIQPART